MDIQFLKDVGVFLLQTAHTAYAFALSPDLRLVHLYWGTRLPYITDYPSLPANRQHSSFNAPAHELLAEFPVYAGIAEFEPLLKVTFADGVRDLRLEYLEYTIVDNRLTICLQDKAYNFDVYLHYAVYSEFDLINRWVEIVNNGKAAVTLETAQSGSVPLTYELGAFRLTHLAGNWAAETQQQHTLVTPGRKVLEGRLNYTGHKANPFFALDLAQSPATETTGRVWFGALHWSGNWKITVENLITPYPLTRVAVGLNDFDFAWHLGLGQTFVTPELTLGYSDGGFGMVSRNLHRYTLQKVLPAQHAKKPRPVLYNSWEAVYFDVNEAAQLELAKRAAELGVEVFVMDDGWFGMRHNDRAGLGDWYPNPTKFPHAGSLRPLIRAVNKLGMRFGLWVEPEMVNPDSNLYHAHPDWAYHFVGRTPTTARNQLILNLAREDVQSYLFGWLDKLLAENDIAYLKWDYNRTISEPGWMVAPREQQREVWVRHVQGLYNLVERLRAAHPDVLFEGCSGGGGRADLGMLARFDQLWTSDNTDPFDRLTIQKGYSLVYPPKTMYCWVTETDLNTGNYSLRYRFHSAFMGSLGIGANLHHWDAAQTSEATDLIALYKRIRPLIQEGEFFRLNGAAFQYLAQTGDSAVVLAFGHQTHFWNTPQRLCLAGLDANAVYELSGDLADGENLQRSGQALMSYGILPRLEGHFSSALIHINKI